MTPEPTGFVTTHWSIVLSAAKGVNDSLAARSLEQLCRAYWHPLYAYVRRRGYTIDDAKDLTQAFFARLLADGRLAFADPARGRFRTFLLTALQNFLINEWAKVRSEKRGGGISFVPFEGEGAEDCYSSEAAAGETGTPEAVFDRDWAATVMARAFDRLRREQQAGGREPLFHALTPFLWGEKSGMSHAEIAEQVGLSPGAVRVAVHRLRRRCRELLREEIAATVARPDEIEEELRYLIQVVARSSV